MKFITRCIVEHGSNQTSWTVFLIPRAQRKTKYGSCFVFLTAYRMRKTSCATVFFFVFFPYQKWVIRTMDRNVFRFPCYLCTTFTYSIRPALIFSLNVNSVSLSSGRRPSSVFDRWSYGPVLAAWRAQRFGVWFWLLTVFSSFLSQSCLVFTNVTSAFGFFKSYVLYKSTFCWLT